MRRLGALSAEDDSLLAAMCRPVPEGVLGQPALPRTIPHQPREIEQHRERLRHLLAPARIE
jgi:hypothetical protein